MSNQQSFAGQSTPQVAARRSKNRVWFTLLTVGGILLVLLVAYNGKSFGLGGIGAVAVWVAAQVVANYADARTR